MNRFLLTFFLMLPVLGHAGIAMQGALAREHTLSPGDAFEGVLMIRNSGSETETVRIFQTDYVFAADGSNNFGTPNTTPRSNAAWLSAGTSLIRVPAGQTMLVSYQGKVPVDAKLQGTYWSILMVENTTALEAASRTEGVKVLARYGVQIVTHIGDTGRRSVRFGRRESARQDDTSSLFVDLENDGERLIFPKLWVELYDAKGNALGRFGGEPVRLYPVCSARYRVALPNIPAGAYKALLLADCGDDQVVGTSIALQL